MHLNQTFLFVGSNPALGAWHLVLLYTPCVRKWIAAYAVFFDHVNQIEAYNPHSHLVESLPEGKCMNVIVGLRSKKKIPRIWTWLTKRKMSCCLPFLPVAVQISESIYIRFRCTSFYIVCIYYMSYSWCVVYKYVCV